MFKITAKEKQLILKRRQALSGSGIVPDFAKFEKNHYEVDDYPFGFKKTKAIFEVVRKGNKETVSRVTVDPNTGKLSKPNLLTYAKKAILGIDKEGKVYPVMLTISHIAIFSGNMKHNIANVFPDDPQFKELYKEF